MQRSLMLMECIVALPPPSPLPMPRSPVLPFRLLEALLPVYGMYRIIDPRSAFLLKVPGGCSIAKAIGVLVEEERRVEVPGGEGRRPPRRGGAEWIGVEGRQATCRGEPRKATVRGPGENVAGTVEDRAGAGHGGQRSRVHSRKRHGGRLQVSGGEHGRLRSGRGSSGLAQRRKAVEWSV